MGISFNREWGVSEFHSRTVRYGEPEATASMRYAEPRAVKQLTGMLCIAFLVPKADNLSMMKSKEITFWARPVEKHIYPGVRAYKPRLDVIDLFRGPTERAWRLTDGH